MAARMLVVFKWYRWGKRGGSWGVWIQGLDYLSSTGKRVVLLGLIFICWDRVTRGQGGGTTHSVANQKMGVVYKCNSIDAICCRSFDYARDVTGQQYRSYRLYWVYRQPTGSSTSTVRAETPTQSSLPPGLFTPALTQTLCDPSMPLGHAMKLAPLKERLPDSSTSKPWRSPFLGGGWAPVV